MQENRSFRFWLVLSCWLLLFCGGLFPAHYCYRSLDAHIRSETRESALHQLSLVHTLLDRAGELQNIEQLHKWLAGIGKELGLHITYIALSGDVLCDSQVSFADIHNLDNFAGRPEFIQAVAEGVGTTIREGRPVSQSQVVAARNVAKSGALPPGILRVAMTVPESLGLLAELRAVFLVIFALAMAATIFAAYAFSRHITSTAGILTDAALAVAEDNYSRHISFQPSHEFYQVANSFNEMAEHVHHTIQWITEEKRKLEAVLNGMQEGVMVLDSTCRIQIINRALSELVPNAALSLGRRPLEMLVNIELHEACGKVLSSAANVEAQPYYLQLEIGKDRIFDVSIVRLDDEDRNLGAIVVFHDISKMKRLERVRQDFVANVSHELRTPLTSIKGYTETLLSDTKPDKETEQSFLQVILRNTNHMVKMVDDLLQLARLDAQMESALKPQPVNPCEALKSAWRACHSLAEPKAIRLESMLPQEGIQVTADYEQLVQVFRNLLENGIRYSPQASSLTVASEVRGEKILFSLHDNGPGIPKQHQQRIFERFYRIEKHRGTLSGSTGLGLAICKHIIENHGGRIWVTSPDPGSSTGTTFHFSLLGAQDIQQAAPGADPGSIE